MSAAWCVRGIFDAANHSPSYFILAIWPFHTLQTSSKLLPIPFRVHYVQLKTGSLVVVGVHIDKSSTLAQYLISYRLYVMKPT